jgi:hypothetical protein
VSCDTGVGLNLRMQLAFKLRRGVNALCTSILARHCQDSYTQGAECSEFMSRGNSSITAMMKDLARCFDQGHMVVAFTLKWERMLCASGSSELDVRRPPWVAPPVFDSRQYGCRMAGRR